jgi:hypothetical protein
MYAELVSASQFAELFYKIVILWQIVSSYQPQYFDKLV